MTPVWNDPDWIASEIERLTSYGELATGVAVAFRMQLERRAAELAGEQSGAQAIPLTREGLSAWRPSLSFSSHYVSRHPRGAR
jgi:hypothetical protein